MSGYEGWDFRRYDHPTCPLGCHPCGRTYYNWNIHDGCCCGSKICDQGAWQATQVWLEKRQITPAQQKARKEAAKLDEQRKQMTARWLIAEKLWRLEVPQWLEAEQRYVDLCERWLEAEAWAWEDWLAAEQEWELRHPGELEAWLAAEQEYRRELVANRPVRAPKRLNREAEVNVPRTKAAVHAEKVLNVHRH